MRKLLPLVFLLASFALPAAAMSLGDGRPTCTVGGCSSQLCTDARMGEAASTCEWVPAYGCYKEHGICEAQTDGTCGWTPTAELLKCLDNPATGFHLNGGLTK